MATRIEQKLSIKEKEEGKELQFNRIEECNDEKILKAVQVAMNEFGFCPNRVGAVAKTLPNGTQDLPELFPPDDGKLEQMFSRVEEQKTHENGRPDGHSRCTFDFCEQSQTNFTSVPQRHESLSCQQLPQCDALKDIFPRNILDTAVNEKMDQTAWHLNGRFIIQPNQKFMAISHVWSDGTGTGAWGEFRVNRCLYHFFRNIARDFGCEGIWWDTICIPTNKALRAKSLINMHYNYERAEVVLVHDCFLRDLKWVDAETACLAILMSPWFSRGWTALELAKSGRGRVKIVFKGQVFKDLDDDIIATSKSSSRRHKITSEAISRLRYSHIETIDDLLNILGSRYTSWARDMATISGLLVGCEIKETDSQQDIYQRILRERFKKICHGHLFHNLPTISKDFSWCPINLLDMPLASSKATLCISENGDVAGTWKLFPLESITEENYIWKDTHPLIAVKLRSALKQKDDHVFLVEPKAKAITRALLAKKVEIFKELRYRFVGSMYFHPPQELDERKNEEIIIANMEVVEGMEAQANYGNKSVTKIQTALDKQKSNHRENIKADEKARRIIPRKTYYQPHSLNKQMGTQAPADREKAEATFTIEERDKGSLNSLNVRLLSEAKDGKKVEVDRLIRRGAEIQFQDKNGRTAMSLAAGGGHDAVVELLLKRYDVQYDSKNNSNQALSSLAVKKTTKAIMELLVERFSLAYDSKDERGRTPLLWAAKKGHVAVVKLLLNWYEIDIDSKDKKGRTPLSWATNKGHEAVTKLLLENEADVKAVCNDGYMPLHHAVHNGHGVIIRLLLEKGVNVNETEEWIGSTPLHTAALTGQEAIVKLLLENGANVNAEAQNGSTPLHHATYNSDEAVAGLLLEKGADIEATDRMDMTPLHRAAVNGHEAVIRLLLEQGADKKMINRDKKTPLDLAIEEGHKAIIKLLQ